MKVVTFSVIIHVEIAWKLTWNTFTFRDIICYLIKMHDCPVSLFSKYNFISFLLKYQNFQLHWFTVLDFFFSKLSMNVINSRATSSVFLCFVFCSDEISDVTSNKYKFWDKVIFQEALFRNLFLLVNKFTITLWRPVKEFLIFVKLRTCSYIENKEAARQRMLIAVFLYFPTANCWGEVLRKEGSWNL